MLLRRILMMPLRVDDKNPAVMLLTWREEHLTQRMLMMHNGYCECLHQAGDPLNWPVSQ